MNLIPTSSDYWTADTEIWHNLKLTIAGSTGFQRWLLEEKQTDGRLKDLSLEQQVQCYLRETLETLAY
ncbi:MAG: hypothetical protein KME64_08415 [Scytonematopsis contorta HA4267-MV1]|jgi:hypothetical protein|nr:hypothetical protein [Scytonematopsis contorta HA4267-MV1]